ncbi:DinB family protein [Rhodocytophaga aerolata]|uniref:DinB family protein n=1 Tax=Rhodocytophaga aerolata TaxID=455078 RepID=A0ABT8RD11_9BACT|nr:DinB family protein [Rhodocytophaga aerolata]MDO1449984.1 DinB family protein [Rhodocytophaga aerolata]
MQKEVLLDMLTQNRYTCSGAFDTITQDNAHLRLNGQTASAGFIYRHVGETMNMFGLFFGIPTDVQSTTMGKPDTGQGQNVEESRQLVEQGFAMFRKYVENTPDSAWLETVETPFFGTVSRARLFSHVLFHNSHHAGQITLTLKRGV